jgi:cold shock CspA family protein
VTRLNRHKSIGFISAVEGGPEFLFEARHVMGLKRFAAIEPSEYVRFEVETEEVDPKQPKARCVMAIERQIDSGEKMVARHPKARRKKPTWRG